MDKHIACGDVVPGCSFEARAATENELIQKVTTHAAQEHCVQQVTPELAAKVKTAIRTR